MAKGTKNMEDHRGKAARAQEAGELIEGEHVAACVKTEPEPWVLGKVVKAAWCQADCGRNLRGKRGEKRGPSKKCFAVGPNT